MDIRRHPYFDRWIRSVRDRRAISKIALRLERLADGNFGDFKSLGDGVYELRIDHGPGYRIYYAQRGPIIVVLALRRRQKQPAARHSGRQAPG